MQRLLFSCAFGLTLAVIALTADAQQCQPTVGLFITTGNFSANAVFTAGPYSLTRSATTIEVRQAGVLIYSHATPTNYNSTYRFYGTNSRYLLIKDVHSTAVDVNYRLKLVNLGATPAPAAFSLLNQTYFTSGTPDLQVQPSQGNGQAVFSFVGVSGEVRDLTIHCSDNGISMCGTGPFTPGGQVIGEATATTVRIKEGGTIRAECLLPAPTILVSPTTLNFETVTEGTAGPSRTVTIQNTGALPLTFSTSTSDAMFTRSPPNGTVPASASATVSVNFSPPLGTPAGSKTAQLTITHNDPSKPAQVISLNAIVASAQPHIAVSTTSIAFGDVVEGTTQSRTFTIQNSGTASLTFSISSNNTMYQISPASGSIATAASRIITVSFVPPAGTPAGVQSGVLTITHNEPGVPARQINLSANVQPAIPRACYSPNPLSFGAVNAGSSATRTVTLTSCGTAQLVVQSASLVSSTASVWSMSPSVPPTFTLAIGATRTFSITFAPPATLTNDASYSAQLQVTTNDGFSPQPASIDVGATGHVPVAIIDIPSAYWDLDFGDTEVGFEFSRPLLIRNLGDRSLSLEIRRIDASDPDTGEFVLETDATTFTIAAGGERTFRQTFTPTGAGARDITIRVQNTNDPTFSQQDILLHGIGTPPVPIDAALVLDRSGSMSETAGEITKIEALKSAASLFVELLRPDIDYIGVTTYNQSSSNVVPLGSVATVKPNALAAIQATSPGGTTGIGGAILKAGQHYPLSPSVTPPAPAHRQVMVVLTDGKENQSPTIRQAIDGYETTPGIFTTYPDLKTYSVGLGLQANVDADRLQELTNRGAGGFYFVTGNLEGANRFNLEAFYFKVFSDAIGNAMVIDPTYVIDRYRTLEVPVPVIVDDKRLIILFVGEYPESSYNLELLDPQGRLALGSVVNSPMTAQVTRRGNWAIVRVALPRPSVSVEHSGIWKLRASLNSAAAAALVEKKKLKDRGSFQSKVAVSASVASNYRLALRLPEIVALGQPVIIRAFMTRGGWPAPRGKVMATVTDPAGSVSSVNLFDDGRHDDGASGDGVFAGVYSRASLKGAYSISVVFDGTTHLGERTRREVFATQFVGQTRAEDAHRSCVTCGTTRGWMALVVALLVFLVAAAVVALAYSRTRAKAS